MMLQRPKGSDSVRDSTFSLTDTLRDVGNGKILHQIVNACLNGTLANKEKVDAAGWPVARTSFSWPNLWPFAPSRPEESSESFQSGPYSAQARTANLRPWGSLFRFFAFSLFWAPLARSGSLCRSQRLVVTKRCDTANWSTLDQLLMNWLATSNNRHSACTSETAAAWSGAQRRLETASEPPRRCLATDSGADFHSPTWMLAPAVTTCGNLFLVDKGLCSACSVCSVCSLRIVGGCLCINIKINI